MRIWGYFMMGCLGCASMAFAQAPQENIVINDPLKPLNKHIYKLNKGLDFFILKPVTKKYHQHTPDVVKLSVRNFFGNLQDMITLGNDVLQMKWRQAGSDMSRIVLNSSVGCLGLFDVASQFGLERNYQDFGMTLAHYGYHNSMFVILPFYGPSTVRDGFGRFVDALFFYPQFGDNTTNLAFSAANAIQKREKLLTFDDAFERAAVDEYAMLRNSYMQQRAKYMANGVKPYHQDSEKELEDFFEEEV